MKIYNRSELLRDKKFVSDYSPVLICLALDSERLGRGEVGFDQHQLSHVSPLGVVARGAHLKHRVVVYMGGPKMGKLFQRHFAAL